MNKSNLNPNAKEFYPSWIKNSKLNPNAPAFCPRCPEPPSNSPSYEFELVKKEEKKENINMTQDELEYYFFNH